MSTPALQQTSTTSFSAAAPRITPSTNEWIAGWLEARLEKMIDPSEPLIISSITGQDRVLAREISLEVAQYMQAALTAIYHNAVPDDRITLQQAQKILSDVTIPNSVHAWNERVNYAARKLDALVGPAWRGHMKQAENILTQKQAQYGIFLG